MLVIRSPWAALFRHALGSSTSVVPRNTNASSTLWPYRNPFLSARIFLNLEYHHHQHHPPNLWMPRSPVNRNTTIATNRPYEAFMRTLHFLRFSFRLCANSLFIVVRRSSRQRACHASSNTSSLQKTRRLLVSSTATLLHALSCNENVIDEPSAS